MDRKVTEFRGTSLEELVSEARLWKRDPGAGEDHLVRLLKKLDGPRILDLHESLVGRATERFLASPADPYLLQVYEAWERKPDDPTLLPAYSLKMNEWFIGYHVFSIMHGDELDPPAATHAMHIAQFGGTKPRHPIFWAFGNSGRIYVDYRFPQAYEAVTSTRWPRTIRCPGGYHMSRIIDHTSPLDMNPIKRMPAPVVAYWQEIQSMVEKINGSPEWWKWLRSGPFRYLELDAGGLDWYEVKRRGGPNGEIKGTPRRAREFSQQGSVLKIGINPDEKAIAAGSAEQGSEQAKTDVEGVLRGCVTRFGLKILPPLVP